MDRKLANLILAFISIKSQVLEFEHVSLCFSTQVLMLNTCLIMTFRPYSLEVFNPRLGSEDKVRGINFSSLKF